MRSDREIEQAIGQLYETLQRAKSDDTFSFGMTVGKLVALGWLYGKPMGDLSVQHTFDDWESHLTQSLARISRPNE